MATDGTSKSPGVLVTYIAGAAHAHGLHATPARPPLPPRLGIIVKLPWRALGMESNNVRHEEPKRSCRRRRLDGTGSSAVFENMSGDLCIGICGERPGKRPMEPRMGSFPANLRAGLEAAQTSTRPFEAYSSILAKSDPVPVFRGGRSISVEGGARSGHLMRPGDRRVHQNWFNMKLALFNSPHFPRFWCLLLSLGLGYRKAAHGWPPGG